MRTTLASYRPEPPRKGLGSPPPPPRELLRPASATRIGTRDGRRRAGRRRAGCRRAGSCSAGLKTAHVTATAGGSLAGAGDASPCLPPSPLPLLSLSSFLPGPGRSSTRTIPRWKNGSRLKLAGLNVAAAAVLRVNGTIRQARPKPDTCRARAENTATGARAWDCRPVAIGGGGGGGGGGRADGHDSSAVRRQQPERV